MKMRLLTIIIYLLFLSCNKEEIASQINKNDILGVWVNLSNCLDSLIIDENKIKRIDTVQKTYLHYYSYNYDVKESSIIIKYIGLDEILVDSCKLKIIFNSSKSEITFEGLSKYHPKYSGETFKKIK